MPHTQHNIHFAKHLNSAVHCLKSSCLPTKLLSYPPLLLAAVSPCLFFLKKFLLCHVSIFLFYHLLFHAPIHITFLLLLLDLASLQNYMRVSGGYATSSPSGGSGGMLAHHLLIYFLWSQHLASFCVLFLTDNHGPSTLPAKARLAVRAKRSPVSSSGKTVICQSLVRYALVTFSAISLFLFTSLRQISSQQTFISLGTQDNCSCGKSFFSVL